MKNKIITAILVVGLSGFASTITASEWEKQLLPGALQKRLEDNKAIGAGVSGQWMGQYILAPDTNIAEVEALKNQLLANYAPEHKDRSFYTSWSTFCLDKDEKTGELVSPVRVPGMQISVSEGKYKSGEFVVIPQKLKSLISGTRILATREVKDAIPMQMEVEVFTIISAAVGHNPELKQDTSAGIVATNQKPVSAKLTPEVATEQALAPVEKTVEPYSMTTKLTGGFLFVASALLVLYQMRHLLPDDMVQFLDNMSAKVFTVGRSGIEA
jgi:hypothetical protein